jgi:hypothetical protein
MNPDDIKYFLLVSMAINYGILLIWFAVFSIAHDWMFPLHSRWFRIPVETFNAIHYTGMAIYKIGIALFNLVPFIALVIVYR